MISTLQPIAPNLWSEGPNPHLLGVRDANGRISFPVPEDADDKGLEVIKLSRTGTLWSFTEQAFKPKPPYDGPEDFEPFLVGFIELPGEIIVEAHIVEASLEQLEINMEMELVISAFDDARSMFSFRPVTTNTGEAK